MRVWPHVALVALLCLPGCDRSAPPPAGSASGCPESSVPAQEVDLWGHRREWCERRDAAGKLVPHGRWIAWYPSGYKAAEGEMRDGVQVGDWTFWDENGRVIHVVRFGNGGAASGD